MRVPRYSYLLEQFLRETGWPEPNLQTALRMQEALHFFHAHLAGWVGLPVDASDRGYRVHGYNPFAFKAGGKVTKLTAAMQAIDFNYPVRPMVLPRGSRVRRVWHSCRAPRRTRKRPMVHGERPAGSPSGPAARPNRRFLVRGCGRRARSAKHGGRHARQLGHGSGPGRQADHGRRLSLSLRRRSSVHDTGRPKPSPAALRCGSLGHHVPFSGPNGGGHDTDGIGRTAVPMTLELTADRIRHGLKRRWPSLAYSEPRRSGGTIAGALRDLDGRHPPRAIRRHHAGHNAAMISRGSPKYRRLSRPVDARRPGHEGSAAP